MHFLDHYHIHMHCEQGNNGQKLFFSEWTHVLKVKVLSTFKNYNLMRNNLITIIVIISILSIISACNDKNLSSSKYYMIFDSIEYVEKFPRTYSLENHIDVDIDVIGYYVFNIVDSLLIFSTTNPEGFWSFVSLSDMTVIGQFLKKGQGPNEFLFSPSIQTATNFFKDNGKQYAAIYDSQKAKVYKIDINETIRRKVLDISIMKDSIPPYLMNFVMLEIDCFLCKELYGKYTQQLRYIMKNGLKESSANLEKLNRAIVENGSNMGYYFNIISTMTKFSLEKNLIVEMPVMLNYLNLYSINENFGKTICIGNKLDNINNIQKQKYPDLVETFFDLRLFKDFWGVVFLNENELSLETGRKNLPSIFFFDWKGKPLAELKLNKHLTSFDIDFNTGFLYGLDSIEEDFFKYDINHILAGLAIKW